MDGFCGPDSFLEVHFIPLELYLETCSVECVLVFLLGNCYSFSSFTQQIFTRCSHVNKFKVRLCYSCAGSPVVGKSLKCTVAEKKNSPLPGSCVISSQSLYERLQLGTIVFWSPENLSWIGLRDSKVVQYFWFRDLDTWIIKLTYHVGGREHLVA